MACLCEGYRGFAGVIEMSDSELSIFDVVDRINILILRLENEAPYIENQQEQYAMNFCANRLRELLS